MFRFCRERAVPERRPRVVSEIERVLPAESAPYGREWVMTLVDRTTAPERLPATILDHYAHYT